MPGRSNIRAAIGLLALIAASLACNAQTAGTPVAGAESSVVFVAPDNKSVIAEGSDVILAVNVADPAGVGKVEFRVDDNLIGTQNVPPEAVQTNLTVRQPWKAQGVQGHFVVAVASRPDGQPIGEAKITLEVVSMATATTTVAAVASTATPRTTVTRTATTPPATPTVAASPTLAPSNTPPPTTAPVSGTGPLLLVTNPTLNMRAGPGINFERIGELKQGETALIIGRNADRSWWYIQKEPARGWVINSDVYIEIVGDTSQVPLVTSSATPVAPAVQPTAAPAQAATSTVGPVADLVIDSVTLNPATPVANQTFTVVIVIRNQGTIDAGTSLVDGLFQPGNERSQMAVPAIAAGQSLTINLPVTLHTSGANQTGVITIDANKDMNEGTNGEANNVRTITYNVS